MVFYVWLLAKNTSLLEAFWSLLTKDELFAVFIIPSYYWRASLVVLNLDFGLFTFRKVHQNRITDLNDIIEVGFRRV